MSLVITNYCDMKDCTTRSNVHLQLPEMVIKAFVADGNGAMVIKSKKRRFDMCQLHMHNFLISDFIKDSEVTRQKTKTQIK